MAEKKQVIVIKKINIAAAGGHGGSWKVAFADFMTAMMAFFLLMWLLNQPEDVKKNVADYFSTPSIIEYNFSNYGVELTLEKLFLDLINEPLKFFQAFIQPVDATPNLMSMGTKKIVLAHLADQLGDLADNVEVLSDEIVFEIPEKHLFQTGSAEPAGTFASVLEKVRQITMGLENSDVFVDSGIFQEAVKGSSNSLALNVGEKRLDMVTEKIQSSLEHETVDIFGKVNVLSTAKDPNKKPTDGSMRFTIKQKDAMGDRKPRELGEVFGKGQESMSVYDNFVKQLTDAKSQKKTK